MQKSKRRVSALTLVGALLAASFGLALACGGESEQTLTRSRPGSAGGGGFVQLGGSAGGGGVAGRSVVGGNVAAAGRGTSGAGGGTAGDSSRGNGRGGTAGALTKSGGKADVGGNAGGGEAGAGAGPVPLDAGCTPVLSSSGLETGFEICDDGTTRRREALPLPEPATISIDECPSCRGPYCCDTDADCTHFINDATGQGPLALCANAHHYQGYCGCVFGCRADADCGPGAVCDYASPLGHCLPATCKANSDCGEGSSCIASHGGPLYYGGAGGEANGGAADAIEAGACAPFDEIVSYDCETPADTCHSDHDCGYGICFRADGKRQCVGECPI